MPGPVSATALVRPRRRAGGRQLRELVAAPAHRAAGVPVARHRHVSTGRQRSQPHHSWWRGVRRCRAGTHAHPVRAAARLGFVETGLTALLVLAGVSIDQAVVATLLSRLMSYWVPIPLGALAWAGRRIIPRRSCGPRPAEVPGQENPADAADEDREEVGENPEHEHSRHDDRLVLPLRRPQQRADVERLDNPDPSGRISTIVAMRTTA